MENAERSIVIKMNTEFHQYPFIIFLTGASGAGKTTLLNSLSKELPADSTVCLHFDSIGVPGEEKMIQQYGSPSEWQRAMTDQWINKITSEHHAKELVILEGQVNLAFIESTFKRINSTRYQIVLVHCDNVTRHKRLHEDRGQPELINENMDNWSNFLKKQAEDRQVPVLDTTAMTIDEIVEWFRQLMISNGLIHND